MTPGTMPRRLVTAYCLMAFAWLQLVRWAFTVWMVLDDSRSSFSDYGGMIILSGLVTLVYLVAMIKAGQWMLAGSARGHLLASVFLVLSGTLSMTTGPTGETAYAFGFLFLIVADIRKMKADPEYSLSVQNYRLADFWFVPWLVSFLCIALVGRGQGALPAGIVHLLSPIAIGVIHYKLYRHPAVLREPGVSRYIWSLTLWAVFYAMSVVLGLFLLAGLSGLAMQGAGQ